MQQRRTTIAVWCDRVLEGAWLLVLVLIPSYFNLLSARHFEPDKATTLRAMVLIMLAVVLIRWLDGIGAVQRATLPGSTQTGGGRWWQRFRAVPLAIPVLAYVTVFLFATVISVTPSTSFWGSYQRLQGTYTNLSYIALAAIIAFNLRSREQLERLITMALLGCLVPVAYGLLQHFQLDPLPWRGDVISRVASTMGNSIFVAAYLILILPFALYGAITAFHNARTAPPSEHTGSDIGWAVGYVLLVFGSLAIVYSSLAFGAVVRTNDLRYWWVYPGALVVTFAVYLVPTMRLHASDRMRLAAIWPAIVALLYIILLGLFYLAGQGSGQSVQAQPGRSGLSWPLWLIGGGLLIAGAYALFFTLPRREAQSSALLLRLAGAGWVTTAVLIVLAIFFTQSRGPWLGAGISMVFFFTLLLVQALRRARASGSPRASLWRRMLAGEVALAALLVVFILALNFIDIPMLERLRDTPYIGRLGRLLDTSAGTTGDVRMKIWFGDDQAGGTVALITSDPIRTLVGWGPESMFVAYNRFYPPSLANVEARGASPDRSHEAYLDELVTKGVLGLASYLFVLISFFVLAWRLMRRSDDWGMQVFFLACMAVVVAHGVEGLTGIPIVASLMMVWVTYGITVAGGALSGAYQFHGAPADDAAPVAPAEVPVAPTRNPSGARSGRRQNVPARGRAAATSRRASQSSGPVGYLVYGIILAIALLGAWFWNVDNVYADMRFQQSQNYTETSLQQQLTGTGYLLDALRMEPGQDFYYLNLGRNLMTIADIRRQTQSTPLGQTKANAYVEDLLRADNETAQTMLMSQSLLETMSYTQAVLQRAYDLSPLNKDNSANLARMHSFWYSRFNQDPQQLQQAINWYETAHRDAPQDVVIINEYAGTVALMGSYLQQHKDDAGATAQFNEARTLLDSSKQLDQKYGDTDVRIGDLFRIQGKYAEATDYYLRQLQANPHALDAQIPSIISSLASQPDQLARVRQVYEAAAAAKPADPQFYAVIGQIAVVTNDLPGAAAAYAKQVQIQPQSFDALRNYTLALSDTKAYSEAVTQAQTMLGIAQNQGLQEQASQVQSLIAFLQQQAQAR